VELDRFLNEKSINVLQSYYFFWTGSSEIPYSKAQLLRWLRQSMLDSRKVAARFNALGEQHKLILKHLLRSPQFKWTPSRVADGFAPALEDLESVGFLSVERDRDDPQAIASVLLPADFARLLSEVTGIDLRPVVQIISLRGFLDALPEDTLEQLLSRWVDTSLPVPSAVEELLQPENLSRRLESLDPDLGNTVRHAILASAGIAKWKPRNRQNTRKVLEEALLGTVAAFELATEEFCIMATHLVVFQEVVESMCSARLYSTGESVRVRGVDFLCDISALARVCMTRSLRLKRTGTPHAGSTKRLQERMLVRGDSDEQDSQLLAWKLAVATRLALVRPSADKTLCRLGELRNWERLSLSRKLRRLRDAVMNEPGPAGQAASLSTRRTLISAIGETAGRWINLDALLSLVIARSLIPLRPALGEINVSSASQPPSLGEFRNILSTIIEQELWLAGLVELGLAEGEPAVRWAQWHKTGSKPTEKPLLLGPDFELVVLHDQASPELIYHLERLADRQAVDRAWRYRLTPESVELAVASGMSSEEIIGLLEINVRNDIPQNVRYSISDWSARIHLAQVFTTIVLEMDCPEALEQAMAVPVFRKLVAGRLTDCIVCLREELPEEVIEQLREAGVYIDSPDEPDFGLETPAGSV